MSSTRLLVLGVVKIFQPVHGYDVRRELLSWRVDEWAHVNPGSIYHALKSLARDNCLEVVPGEPSSSGRPEKTTYQLTDDGETEFFVLLRQMLWKLEMAPERLAAALCFFPYLPRRELQAIMESRLAQLDAARQGIEFGLNTTVGAIKPEHVQEQLHLMLARLDGEEQWTRDFAKRLAAGQYNLAQDGAPNPA